MLWLRLVELALLTTHESTELPPARMLEGVAVKDVIDGCKAGVSIVAEQVLDATCGVVEASVPSMVIVWVPGA